MDKNTMMQNLARALNEKDCFNGAWLYAERGEIGSKGVLGFRDPENTLPITEDTIFQLASVSKTFTASAVMLLVREGKLGLEDKITKFFPELTAYEGGTIRHLLTHTGGIPDYFDDADWFIKKPRRNRTSPRGKACITPTPAIISWRCWWSGSPAFPMKSSCRRRSSSPPA